MRKRYKKIVGWITGTAAALSLVPNSFTIAASDSFGGSGQPSLKMWYDSPATDWESQASPLGNGFLGAMIFGGIESDQILINEHSLWSGGPGADKNYDGGHSGRTDKENVRNLEKVQSMLQDAMTDFTENKSAYIEPETGNVIANDYEMNDEIKALIDTLKGDKSKFGSYEQLSNIMITDEDPSKSKPIRIESNSANKNSENMEFQQGPEKAFDGDLDTKWFSVGGLPWGTGQEMPAWVTVEYQEPLKISGYNIVSGNDASERDPQDWVVYGSVDGKHFEEIDRQELVFRDVKK